MTTVGLKIVLNMNHLNYINIKKPLLKMFMKFRVKWKLDNWAI